MGFLPHGSWQSDCKCKKGSQEPTPNALKEGYIGTLLGCRGIWCLFPSQSLQPHLDLSKLQGQWKPHVTLPLNSLQVCKAKLRGRRKKKCKARECGVGKQHLSLSWGSEWKARKGIKWSAVKLVGGKRGRQPSEKERCWWTVERRECTMELSKREGIRARYWDKVGVNGNCIEKQRLHQNCTKNSFLWLIYTCSSSVTLRATGIVNPCHGWEKKRGHSHSKITAALFTCLLIPISNSSNEFPFSTWHWYQ